MPVPDAPRWHAAAGGAELPIPDCQCGTREAGETPLRTAGRLTPGPPRARGPGGGRRYLPELLESVELPVVLELPLLFFDLVPASACPEPP